MTVIKRGQYWNKVPQHSPTSLFLACLYKFSAQTFSEHLKCPKLYLMLNLNEMSKMQCTTAPSPGLSRIPKLAEDNNYGTIQ